MRRLSTAKSVLRIWGGDAESYMRKKNKSILIFDVMAGGHGVKNMCAILRSSSFRKFAQQTQVDLLIPVMLNERLCAELGDLTLYGIRRVYTAVGIEDYHTIKGRIAEIRVLLLRLLKGRYSGCFVQYADPIVLFLPLLRFLNPFTRIGVYIFRALSHYQSMGYKIGPHAQKEVQRAVSKNYFLLFCQRLKLVAVAWFQDEGAVEWFNAHGGTALWSPTALAFSDIGCLRGDQKESGKVRFTLFGGLSKRKGVFDLLQAWERLSDEVKAHASLQLIGPCIAHDRPAVEAEVKRLNDPSIVLDIRFVPNEEIRNIYRQTDVLLLLYRGAMVGPSGVLVQAAAWGVPVLTTDIGWIGKTVKVFSLGRTVNPHDSELLTQTINEIIMNGIEADKEHGFIWARKHLPEAYGMAYVETLKRVL